MSRGIGLSFLQMTSPDSLWKSPSFWRPAVPERSPLAIKVLIAWSNSSSKDVPHQNSPCPLMIASFLFYLFNSIGFDLEVVFFPIYKLYSVHGNWRAHPPNQVRFWNEDVCYLCTGSRRNNVRKYLLCFRPEKSPKLFSLVSIKHLQFLNHDWPLSFESLLK